MPIDSVARSGLTHSWRRTWFVVGILAAAGVVAYLQLGISTAQLLSFAKSERMARAEIIVVGGAGGFGRSSVPNVLSPQVVEFLQHSESIAAIEPVLTRSQRVSLPGRESLELRIVNPESPALSLPRRLDRDAAEVLERPLSILLTEADGRRLGLDVGAVVRHRNHELHVLGIVRAGLGSGQSMISSETFETIRSPSQEWSARHPLSILVQVAPGRSIETVARELDQALDRLNASALTQDQLVQRVTEQVLSARADIRGFLIVALIVGGLAIVIVLQASSSMIADQRTEFGILLALGVSRIRISCIVLEQVAWVGLLSAAYALVGALFSKLLLGWLDVEFALSMDFVSSVSGLLLGATLLGGVAALPGVFAIKPVDLLR